MPLYEYRCESCGRTTEVMQSFTDPPPAGCEVCGGPMKKLPSAPGIQFKGSGWYVSDYARAGSPSTDAKDKAPAAAGKEGTKGSSEGGSEKGSDKKADAPAAAPAAAAKSDGPAPATPKGGDAA